MLDSVISNPASKAVTLETFIICTMVSLVLGVALSLLHRYQNTCSKNFFITLAILPAVVQIVIMLVNGNLGAGVAVMGAFSLVRFRSVPGTSREIGSVFLAMAIGLATGMGYLGTAALLLLMIGGFTLFLVRIPWDRPQFLEKELKITIPEDLDYYGIFDDIFADYTNRTELVRVKTVNMGSLYELVYTIRLKADETEKEFLDQIRCRNGNLPIICGRRAVDREEL